MFKPFVRLAQALIFVGLLAQSAEKVSAADRLTGLHSAQVMSQSMPWIAQEAGLFKKYDLDFRLVFIPSSPVATAATLNGDAEIGVTGAIGQRARLRPGFHRPGLYRRCEELLDAQHCRQAGDQAPGGS
jgi:ABC-type nitrate/sulfonate/bicarbonate transport system substrate-binding protein